MALPSPIPSSTSITAHIRVESEQGKGTTFLLYLPASESMPEPEDLCPASSPPRGKGTVLVMDDEEIIREMACELLSDMGYRTLSAESGEETLEIFKANPGSIDLVLMDLTIPGGRGGREAASRLLEIDPLARLIVSSGYSNDPIMANHKDYGFREAIVKPYLYDELFEKVSRTLES